MTYRITKHLDIDRVYYTIEKRYRKPNSYDGSFSWEPLCYADGKMFMATSDIEAGKILDEIIHRRASYKTEVFFEREE